MYVNSIAQWISNLEWEDIPRSLRIKAEDHYLDTIGAIIVGSEEEPTHIAKHSFTSDGPCRLFLNNDERRSMVHAARINAVAAHSLEIDDTEGLDHSGAVVVPVLLAISDSDSSLTHEQLITALISGYEVGRRIQNAMGGYAEHNSSGWHSTATCGVFAAAVAAGKLLELSELQLGYCLSIASSLSAGGWAFSVSGAMTKQLHPGFAAGNGIIAAQLAKNGATGPLEIFEDVWGSFFQTHGGSNSAPEKLLENLGSDWAFGNSAIKPYAACRSAHSAIDALRAALIGEDFSPQEVQSIQISLDPYLSEMIGKPAGATEAQNRMSLPLSLALLLEGKELLPWDFKEDSVKQASHWIHKISTTSDAGLKGQEPVIRISTSERELRYQNAFARGSSIHPLSRGEVINKFTILTQSKLSRIDKDRILRSVLRTN